MEAACPGFKFAGIACGLKKTQAPDLALMMVAEDEVPAAAVFTRNRARAAPVLLSESHVKSGLARAIIINSGNANACTGARGAADAKAMAHYAAKALGCDEKRILVASTGVIGQPLAIERIVEATPRLCAAARPDGLEDFTRAIMTTDRFEKRSLQILPLGPKTRARVVGVAKGAGMIAPNMATTLAFVATDAAVTPKFLRAALREEIEVTFNQISVDGDTSTNDSVFLMASGAAKNKPIDGGDKGDSFRAALRAVLEDLSRQIVRDGEGALHVVTIEVLGAENGAAAERVARRIGTSPLVKTAFFGADPNWGRIVCAVGNSGVDFDPSKIDIAVGEFEIVRGGVGPRPGGGAARARGHAAGGVHLARASPRRQRPGTPHHVRSGRRLRQAQRRLSLMKRLPLLALALGGCVFQPSKGPPVDATPHGSSRSSPAPSSQKPQPHSARLGWSAWNTDTTLFYCSRRLDDLGNPVGVTGPCFKMKADDPNAHRLVAFTNVNQADLTQPDAAPPGCKIELEDAKLVPQKQPARAWLVGAGGRDAPRRMAA